MKERHSPRVGDVLVPDGWNFPEPLQADDGYKDTSFPGCQFRVPCALQYSLAVNVTVTGKPHWVSGAVQQPWYRSRVKIEFVGDGEPSTFTRGWLYHGEKHGE